MAKRATKKATTKKAVKKSAKKSTKKAVSKSKRSRCGTKGCRRLAVDGTLCRPCAANGSPIDVVMRTTELQAAQWASLDAEIRNAMQGIELSKKDDVIAASAFEKARRVREVHRSQLVLQANALRTRYTDITNQIATQHGLDPSKMSIDPETRVVRDLRNETAKAS